MKYGYELEFFVVKKNDIVLPTESIRNFSDGGAVLVEARGEPQTHPKLAEVALYLAIDRLKAAAKKDRVQLLLANENAISPKLLRKARCCKKDYYEDDEETPIEEYANPVKLVHKDPDFYTAGLHIHLSCPYADRYKPFDMFKYLGGLDRRFHTEITQAKRYKGAYRMKDYGFEYRSLPATINVKAVTKALIEIEAGKEL